MSALKAFILIFFLALGLQGVAQNAKPRNNALADDQIFHFGYSVAYSAAKFTISHKDGYHVDLNRLPTDATKHEIPFGFNINLIMDYRVTKYLHVRTLPGIQFVQRNLFLAKNLVADNEYTWKTSSVFMELPILLKYRSERHNNISPYIIAGGNLRFDLNGADELIFSAEQRMLKLFDFYPELGVGIDFYLQNVIVAMELKFSVGLLNLYTIKDLTDRRYNLYKEGIENIYSRIFVLSFHVE